METMNRDGEELYLRKIIQIQLMLQWTYVFFGYKWTYV